MRRVRLRVGHVIVPELYEVGRTQTDYPIKYTVTSIVPTGFYIKKLGHDDCECAPEHVDWHKRNNYRVYGTGPTLHRFFV